MALSTARMHKVRGRPPHLAAGISSLIHSHSSSVRSLGYVCSFIFPFYTTHEDFSDRLLGAAIPLYAPYTHPSPLVSATPMHPHMDKVLDAPSAALRIRSPAPSALRHIRRTMLRPHVVKAASMIPCVPQREHAR